VVATRKQWGLLFVLVGPPGAGKNALMNEVLKRTSNLKQLPTATTRPMRPTEQQGREHLFVSRSEFQDMIDHDRLIEWQEVHGQLYGMPRTAVEQALTDQQDLVADIDVLGATYLRSVYPDNVILVFIRPPSLSELEDRMRARGETETEIVKRMQRVNMEMQYAVECDYLIVNDDFEEACDILYGVVLAERSHRAVLTLRNELQVSETGT
jgi:guanylate kinase